MKLVLNIYLVCGFCQEWGVALQWRVHEKNSSYLFAELQCSNWSDGWKKVLKQISCILISYMKIILPVFRFGLKFSWSGTSIKWWEWLLPTFLNCKCLLVILAWDNLCVMTFIHAVQFLVLRQMVHQTWTQLACKQHAWQREFVARDNAASCS